MDSRGWAGAVLSHFDACDASKVSSLLFRHRPRPASDPEIRRSINEVVTSQGRLNPEKWSQFLISHYSFLISDDSRLDKLTQSIAHFSLVFQDALQGSWSLPVVYGFIRKVFTLMPTSQVGKSTKRLEAVVSELQKLLGTCQRTSEKPPDSKLMGLIGVMNMLFRLYFRINNLQLCVNLLKIVNNPHSKLPGLRYFPMGQQVEFRYYEGRLSVYEQQIGKAEECLEYSFAHCLPGSVRNKRVILQYLIPVKATRGKFPSRNLLEKYSQTNYIPLLEAIKQGDIRTFEAELRRNQDLFITAGILIMMQNLVLVAYRNLFKKTYLILKQSQIPLQRFVTALGVVGGGVEMDGLECVLVTLIAKGWVKGYISHEKAMIVLRKVDPFPKIQDC